MSETITNLDQDMAAVNADQANHEASFITHNRASGLGMDLAGNVSGVPEISAAEAPAAEIVSEALNPDRALVRIGNRLTGLADRRTTKQVLAEQKDAVIDLTEVASVKAKKVATKVGIAAVLSVDTALETAGKIRASAAEKKSSVKGFIAEQRDASLARKVNRFTARAEHRDKRIEKVMLKEAHGMNKDFDKQKKNEYKSLFDEIKQNERTAKKTATKTRRAEFRHDVSEQAQEKAIAAAKFAGKAALFTGVAVAYGTYQSAKLGAELGMKLDQKTAEVTAKGVRKTVEVAQDTGDAAAIKVRRGQQAARVRIEDAQVNRYDKKIAKAAAKANKYENKINKIVSK